MTASLVEQIDRLAAPIIDRVTEVCEWHCRAQYRMALRIHQVQDKDGTDDWKVLFGDLFHESFDDYIKRAKTDGIRKRVKAFELDYFGESDL